MHAIRPLTLENVGPFKGRTVVPCAPITLFFGENGAGKSAILRSLLLLKQSVPILGRQVEPLRLTGPDVNYGSARAVVFGHELDRAARIGVHLHTGHEYDRDDGPEAFTEDDIPDWHGQEYTSGLTEVEGSTRLKLLHLAQYLGREHARWGRRSRNVS